MRFFLSVLLGALLASSVTRPGYAQNTQARTPADTAHFFTGTVTAIGENTLTVNRMVLGKSSATKTFLVTAETKFEGGKPWVRAQVTVRYVTAEEGDRAVTVILRRAPK